MEQRLAAQKYFPIEWLMPRHYKAFTEIENRLLATTPEEKRKSDWDSRKLLLDPETFQTVSDYVAGLRDDFLRADRIMGNFIIHAPNVRTSFRWQIGRIPLELSYYYRYTPVWFDLKSHRVAVKDLRRLTAEIVEISYRAGRIVRIFERRNHDFAVHILRKC